MNRPLPGAAMDAVVIERNPSINPIWFGRGMAAIRIFFGLIIFANGLAKLDASWAQIDIGAYHANLITRQGAQHSQLRDESAPGL